LAQQPAIEEPLGSSVMLFWSLNGQHPQQPQLVGETACTSMVTGLNPGAEITTA
jgi:hypothetical protein